MNTISPVKTNDSLLSQGAAPASHSSHSQSLPPHSQALPSHSQGPVMKDVFYGGQEDVENNSQYATCYTPYRESDLFTNLN